MLFQQYIVCKLSRHFDLASGCQAEVGYCCCLPGISCNRWIYSAHKYTIFAKHCVTYTYIVGYFELLSELSATKITEYTNVKRPTMPRE